MTTITVEGSHGHLLVDMATGYILARDSCDCEDCAKYGDYSTILFFDPLGWDDWTRKHHAADILHTSFVDRVGYARAMRTMHEWQGVDYGDADADPTFSSSAETELLTYQPAST